MRFCDQKNDAPNVAMIYLAILFFKGWASSIMQARCLFSMLLPAAFVDGPVVGGLEPSNKIEA